MPADGILLVDKPEGLTSHDVVAGVRKCFGTKEIGHAGTLDPIATGLLICLIGRATKLCQFVSRHHKNYQVTAVLNEMRDTYDRDGQVTAEDDKSVTEEELLEAIRKFPRQYNQVPPPFSAKKTEGKAAHRLARAGKPTNLKPQDIEIFSMQLVEFDFPKFTLELEVSAGTYVRSLVVDLAKSLGTYAYVDELRRTASGPFSVDDAVTLQELKSLKQDRARKRLLPMDRALTDMPRVDLDGEKSRCFSNGRTFEIEHEDGRVAVFSGGQLLGIAMIEAKTLKPQRVLQR